MATAAADCIGPYRAIRQLGAGGMGEVFLARDEELGRNIAIKLLPAHLAADAEHLARLRNEARSASSLNHPNIVTIYEIGRDDANRTFMAMEYVDGQTLREVMRGALPVRKALQLATQLADGLAAAHKRGLVHRDLKPENIMVTSDGVVKILDFGLAKSLDVAGKGGYQSDPGTVVGTYSYMSPEQARAAEVDYRSDQFSLGAIVYEMLTGARAFEGASGVETLFMVVRDEPAPLSAVASHVPAPLRWIVDRCLSKDPDDRYVSTRDLARDLQYLRDHFSETGVVAPIRDKEAMATRVKKRWPVAAAIAFALLAGSLLTAWASRPEPRVITSERYLTYSGHDYSPAVSPDGKLIAFASARDGVQRIWLKQVAGGSEVALTEGADDFPRFTPDGANLIYIRAEPDQRSSLWRVPVVGGEPRRILDDVITADFSPDGSTLAFTRNVQENGAGKSVLMLANADGSNVRELARTGVGTVHPRWSPDGSRIAAVAANDGRVTQSVIVVNASGGPAKVLTAPAKPGEVSSVIWTRDGRHVVYLRAESVEVTVGSTAKVIRHHVDNDTLEEIGWTTHNGAMLDVIGSTLVLDARSPRDNLREVSAAAPDANAVVDRWITRGNSSDRQPSYSPDGKSVIFSSNRSGNLDLWLTSEDGGVRRITDDASEDWDPGFTPDGKKIVWSSGRSGNLEIWIANADGSEARQISQDGVDAENPSATRDGWVIYNSFNGAKAGIWKVRQDGTRATHIVKARTALPEVSGDGQYVSYIVDGRTPRAQLRVARVADGKDMGFTIPLRQIRRTTAILGRSRWMPDSKRIAYLAQDAEGVNGIFVQDFVPNADTSATRKPLGGFDRERATESFGIAPAGTTMTVAGWEQLFSIFSIEGVPGVSKGKKENES